MTGGVLETQARQRAARSVQDLVETLTHPRESCIEGNGVGGAGMECDRAHSEGIAAFHLEYDCVLRTGEHVVAFGAEIYEVTLVRNNRPAAPGAVRIAERCELVGSDGWLAPLVCVFREDLQRS